MTKMNIFMMGCAGIAAASRIVAASPAADVDQTEIDTAEVAATPEAVANGVNGFGHIVLSNTNLCVQPSGNFDGAPLELHGCNSSLLQNWLLSSLPGTADFRIFNQAGNLCI